MNYIFCMNDSPYMALFLSSANFISAFLAKIFPSVDYISGWGGFLCLFTFPGLFFFQERKCTGVIASFKLKITDIVLYKEFFM